MEIDRTAAIWKNANKMLADPKKARFHADTEQLLVAVSEEWERRAKLSVEPKDWFKWPETDASGGSGSLKFSKALSEGMFSYLEYHVGRTNGEASPDRQSILSRIFEGSLPPVFPKDYMDAWGGNKSPRRRRKMAETIAAFTRNAKRRDDDRLSEAIAQWESDLDFLHDRNYVGRFGFAWPSTRTGYEPLPLFRR